MSTPRPAAAPDKRRGPLTRLLDLFSSVWLGIWLLVALFVYMAVGSALPPVRQLRIFEMTEFEWFHWWPFTALIVAICLNITVATLRRIPLNLVNLGVWMIHAGILVMSAGAVWYFATKTEGDTPVFRRQVVIEAPRHEPITLVALPGASKTIPLEGGGARTYTVAQTDPNWPLLSEDDKGKTAYSVTVMVADTPATHDAEPAQPFMRQLFDGYPQYTEDVLPGSGRAINNIGRKLVDESLSMSLRPESQEWYYLVNSRAIYLRALDPDTLHDHDDSAHEDEPHVHTEPVAMTDWVERPVPALPRYNDYIGSLDDAWLPGVDPARVTLDPLDLRVKPASVEDPFADVEVRITGYTRYAVPLARRVAGDENDPLAPYAFVRVESTRGESKFYDLTAFDPEHRVAEDGALEFRWVDNDEDFEQVGTTRPPVLAISTGDASFAETFTLDGSVSVGEDAPFQTLGDTGYAFRVRSLIDRLPISESVRVSLAVVDFRDSEGREFTRLVNDDPTFTRDVTPRPAPVPEGEAPFIDAPFDDNLVVSYDPPALPPVVTLVARPDQEGVVAVLGSTRGEPVRVPLRAPQRLEIDDETAISLLEYSPTSRVVTRPQIIPSRQRDPQMRDMLAMVRVEVTAAGSTESRWVQFSQHLLPGPEYAYGGRFQYSPETFVLADGRAIELMFSRERERLPSPVILDDFVLHAHVGGFTGDTASIRDWESLLRFSEDGAWGDIVSVRTNKPAEHRRFRFFQSMWDRPPMDEGDPLRGGLNFTGLGVGNRNGVGVMLAGSTLAVIGMLYAFYAKPAIKRRRADRVRAAVERGEFGQEAAARLARRQGALSDNDAVERELVASPGAQEDNR